MWFVAPQAQNATLSPSSTKIREISHSCRNQRESAACHVHQRYAHRIEVAHIIRKQPKDGASRVNVTTKRINDLLVWITAPPTRRMNREFHVTAHWTYNATWNFGKIFITNSARVDLHQLKCVCGVFWGISSIDLLHEAIYTPSHHLSATCTITPSHSPSHKTH